MRAELDESLDRVDALVLDRAAEDGASGAYPETDWLAQNVLEMVPALLWSTDPDGKVCYVNQRVVDYTGRTLADLVFLRWDELIHPDDRGEVVRTWSHAVRTRSTYRLSHRLLRADGEYRRFLVQGAPLLDGRGRMTQILGFSIDIDESTPALACGAREFGEMRGPGVRLSARERTIVRMMGHGLSNKTIARRLDIAPETVKSHAKSIFWKLTARCRAEAVYRAAALGLI